MIPKVCAAFLIPASVLLTFGQRSAGQAIPVNPPPPRHVQKSLQALVDGAVAQALQQFSNKKLQPDQLAVTLVDLRDFDQPLKASYRGDVQIYPASVVKLFYLAAAHRWMEDGQLKDTDELRRALRDMIVASYNEATHYIVDVLTGTTSGPELSEAEIDEWFNKRNAVNRYFSSLGYTNINVNKKPWCEGPYGREMQSIKMHQAKRNMLTTDATARLVAEIVTGRAGSAKRCAEMMDLMQRDPFKKLNGNGEPEPGQAFSGPALPPGSKLWSKAGWTSQTRHDATYIELSNGARFVLVIFTTDHANEREIIPALARTIIDGFTIQNK